MSVTWSISAMETFLVKPKSYKDASRVTFVKLVFRYSSQGNKEEVKRNILPLQPVQILSDVDNWRDFPPICLLLKLEMTGRTRRVYDRKRNKQLYSKPRKSTSTGSLFLFFVIYRTQNSICHRTLVDITHNRYLKIVDCSGVKDKAANVAERERRIKQ